MGRRIAILIVLGLLLTTSGCGTMLNLAGQDELMFESRSVEECKQHERPPYPYGGVCNDIALLKNAKQPIDVASPLIDMPFSLTADTLTLPWTIYRALHPEPNASAPPNSNSEPVASSK